MFQHNKPKGQNSGHTPIKYQIFTWASSKMNYDDMITQYNISKEWWEKGKYIELNKMHIIKDLSKCHRHDILKYIITTYPKYIDDISLVGFTPLHSAIWCGEEKENYSKNETNINDIKNTLQVLLNNYKFRILISCQNDEKDKFIEHKYETILGALYHTENKLSQNIKDDIYEYIIDKKNDKWYMNDFQLYINKLNANTFDLFLNKILFIFNQYFNKAILIFFKNLTAIRMTNNIEFNKKIDMLADIVVSKPNNKDLELDKYFKTSSINTLTDTIINAFISFDDIWINKEISTLNGNNEEIYKNINYKNLFSFYGSLYHKVDCEIMKNKILKRIYQFINNKINGVDIYMLHFMLHSKFNLKNMNFAEKKLISFCVEHYYDSKNIYNAIKFENVFMILLNVSSVKPIEIHSFLDK